jgi:pimeloyl-ACP methyl ester carboxylesterase
VQPILALHGWLDNAGSYDPLMQLLPPSTSLLAIDLPGHGFSSHYPFGFPFHFSQDIVTIRRIVRYFNWEKIKMLGHSMGSTYSFIYSGVFPNDVDKIVGIDILRPLALDSEYFAKNGGAEIDKLIETVTRDQEPPLTTEEDMIKKQYEGSKRSVTLETSKLLLKRGAFKSTKNPSLIGLRRDARLKCWFMHALPHEHLLELASRIKCEVYNIKAKGGMYYEKKSYYKETMDVIRKNTVMEYYEVDGTHHVHLNTPENVVELIQSILCSRET